MNKIADLESHDQSLDNLTHDKSNTVIVTQLHWSFYYGERKPEWSVEDDLWAVGHLWWGIDI